MASGSRIVIRGVRFTNSSKVRVGGRDAQILSLTSRNIEALLPSVIPAGSSGVTVSKDDGVSRPFRLRITKAAFGIFSENGKSWGQAKTSLPFVLTGTGLGDVRNPDVFVAGKPARVVGAERRAGEPGIEEIEFVPPAGARTATFNMRRITRTSDGRYCFHQHQHPHFQSCTKISFDIVRFHSVSLVFLNIVLWCFRHAR